MDGRIAFQWTASAIAFGLFLYAVYCGVLTYQAERDIRARRAAQRHYRPLASRLAFAAAALLGLLALTPGAASWPGIGNGVRFLQERITSGGLALRRVAPRAVPRADIAPRSVAAPSGAIVQNVPVVSGSLKAVAQDDARIDEARMPVDTPAPTPRGQSPAVVQRPKPPAPPAPTGRTTFTVQQPNPLPPLDMAPRGERTDRGEGSERLAVIPRADGGDRADRRGQGERADRRDGPDFERADAQGRPDKGERIDRSGRPEQVERAERSSRPDRVERIDRPERIDGPERVDRPERPGRRSSW